MTMFLKITLTMNQVFRFLSRLNIYNNRNKGKIHISIYMWEKGGNMIKRKHMLGCSDMFRNMLSSTRITIHEHMLSFESSPTFLPHLYLSSPSNMT